MPPTPADWLARAQALLRQYRLRKPAVALLAHTHNWVYRVEANEQTYVLRVHLPNATRPLIEAEIAWLDALSAQGLPVPRPIRNRYDGLVTQLSEDEQAIYGVLFAYQVGTEKTPAEFMPHHAAAVGALLAQMHHIAESYPIPAQSVRPRLDFDGLFGETGRYSLHTAQSHFSAAQQSIMQASIARLHSIMAELDAAPHRFLMVHGDLHLQNILFADEQAKAIDFEYCGLGYDLYDFTPLLWQLKLLPNYTEYEASIWAGYTALRPLPEAQRAWLTPFIVGRQVASLRWVALNADNPAIAGKAPAIIAARISELERYLSTNNFYRNP